MFIRFATIAGEKPRVSAALGFIENSVRPEVEASAGSKGLATLISVDETQVVGASYWSDDAAMEVAEEVVALVRQQAVDLAGGTLRKEEYEIVAFFRRSTPAPGVVAELARFELDLAKLNQLIAIFNDDAITRLKAAAGFCCAQLFVDREFGHGMVATSWKDESSARAFKIPARELRAQLVQHGSMTVPDSEFYRLTAM